MSDIYVNMYSHTEWVTVMYIYETYSPYGMSDITYLKRIHMMYMYIWGNRIHITEWVTFMYRNVFTLRNEWPLCTYKKRTEWVTFMYTLRNEWPLCTYKKRTEWVTFSHEERNEWPLCTYKERTWHLFTLRNEWPLCTYKKRIHITEWVTLRNWPLCTYKKRIHITEWHVYETYSPYGMSNIYVHIRNVFSLRNEWSFMYI